MADTPADDSAAYWNRTHDRPRLRDAEPDRPRTPARDDPPSRPTGRERRRPGPPQVRSGTDALGGARIYLDAALMLGFGIFCLVAAGAGGDRAFLVVAIGLFAIGYAGYIAFVATSYTMPYSIYALAVVGGIWLLFG